MTNLLFEPPFGDLGVTSTALNHLERSKGICICKQTVTR